MNPAHDIALIDQLRAEPAETPWLEFKGNNSAPEVMRKCCSALANSARIEGNAAQATVVINRTLEAGLIRVADAAHPRAGYVPHWG